MSYNADCTLPEEILEQVTEQGPAIVPELIRIVFNATMQAGRQAYLA
jgi:hypothetical protein